MSPAILFQKLRFRLAGNAFSLLWNHAWWRIVIMGYCCAVLWGFLFLLSSHGFHELKTRWNIPLQQSLIDLPFDMFFFTLTILLIFSTGLILYSSLFAGRESEFLLASPMPDDHVFSYKLQGAIAFSSWGFLLLGSPILMAYGIEVRDGAPWYYYVAMPLFFLGFLLIPGCIGAIACLLVVNILPRHRKHFLVGFIVLVIALAVYWGVSWYRESRNFGVGSRPWFESFLNELSYLGGRLVPYHWMTRGMRYAAIGRTEAMLYNLALVWSHGLFLYVVTVWLATKLYRRGFNRIASGGTLRKKYGGHWMDRSLTALLFPLDAQTRMLIVKDFRAFRRDPAQWAQILIFLGMGSMYFLAMRRFYESDLRYSFRIGISLLTLIATGFLMCAYTGRFIYPMLSLEGSKFWILGLLPLDRSRLLVGKFVFSAIGCLVAGQFLIVFANYMLGMPWLIVVVHSLTIALLGLGFSALSVGLGACMPNFRETDPSKVAIGFGGTVNLIVGLMFLTMVVVLLPMPLQLFYVQSENLVLSPDMVPWYYWIGMALGVLVGVGTIIAPMRAGVIALRRMEF